MPYERPMRTPGGTERESREHRNVPDSKKQTPLKDGGSLKNKQRYKLVLFLNLKVMVSSVPQKYWES